MIVNPDGSVSVSAMPNVYLGSIPFLHGGWLQQMQQQAAQLAQTQAAQAQAQIQAAQAQAAQAQAQAQAAQAQVDPYSAIEPYLGFNLNPDDFYSGMPLSPQTAPATTKPAPELMPSHQPVVPVAPAQPDVDLSIGYGLVPSPVMTQKPGTNYWTSLLGTALGGGLLTNLMATYLRNRNAVTGIGVDGKPFVNIPDTPPRPWFNMATYSDTPGIGISEAQAAELRGSRGLINYLNDPNKPRYKNTITARTVPEGVNLITPAQGMKPLSRLQAEWLAQQVNPEFSISSYTAPMSERARELALNAKSFTDPKDAGKFFDDLSNWYLDRSNIRMAVRNKIKEAVHGQNKTSKPQPKAPPVPPTPQPTPQLTPQIPPVQPTPQPTPRPTLPTRSPAQTAEQLAARNVARRGLSSRVAQAMGKTGGRALNFTLPASIAVLAASLADPGRVEAAQQSVPQLPIPESTNWFPTLTDMIAQGTIQGINDVPVFLQLLSQVMDNMPEDGDLMW